MEKVIELDKFDGKRNTALTFIIPPNYDFRKDYNKIKKIHSTIKSSKRKGKLVSVTTEIDSKLTNIVKFSGNGCIICCGLDKSSKPDYYQIDINVELKEFEYYYGYGFETNRIKQLLFKENIQKLESNEETEIRNLIKKGFEDGLSVVKTELNVVIEQNMVSKVYYFSHENVPWQLLNSSMCKGFKIIMMNMEDVNNRDMAKKYGDLIGYLYYKIDVDTLAK